MVVFVVSLPCSALPYVMMHSVYVVSHQICYECHRRRMRDYSNCFTSHRADHAGGAREVHPFFLFFFPFLDFFFPFLLLFIFLLLSLEDREEGDGRFL